MRRSLITAAAVLAVSATVAGCTGGSERTTGTGSSTADAGFPCPAFTQSTSGAATPTVRADRVRVGAMSYPAAGEPFNAASNREYVPFANLVGSQSARVEAPTPTSMGWDSVIALARISSGDGAWGGQPGAEMVSQCSLSITWRGIDYHPKVRRDEAVRVDGHQAWIRVTDLSFNVPGIRADAEVQTVVLVQVDQESYAYLSYLPNSAPELARAVKATLDGLRVD